jgi:hypothetical protein
MRMATLRCKNPELIHKELTIYLILYNCIRLLIWEAALKNNVDLYHISFKAALHTIVAWSISIKFLKYSFPKTIPCFLLDVIAKNVVPHRPHRCQPKATKKRKNKYQLLILTMPRHLMVEIPHRNQYHIS